MLGLLALISTELLQREVFRQSSFLPPLIRTVGEFRWVRVRVRFRFRVVIVCGGTTHFK